MVTNGFLALAAVALKIFTTQDFSNKIALIGLKIFPYRKT
jgi:hypothetical protein